MRIFLWIIVLILSASSYAQDLEVRTIGGTGVDVFYDVLRTTDGYVAVGSTSSTSSGSSDILVVKLDDDMNTVWSRIIGTDGADEGNSIAQNMDGNYVIVGSTSFGDTGGYDVFLGIVDPDGSVLQQRTYGTPNWDFGTAAELWNAEVWIGAKRFNPENNHFELWLFSIDGAGNQLNSRTWSLSGDAEIKDLLAQNDSLLMSIQMDTNEALTAHVMAINDSLTEIWSTELEYTDVEGVLAGHLDYNEISGLGWSVSLLNTIDFEDECALVTLDLDGAVTGIYPVASTGDQYGYTMVWSNNLAMVTAESNVYGAGGLGIYLERRINNGIWTEATVFGGIRDETPWRIIQDEEGRLIIAGQSNSYDGLTMDGFLMRIPNDLLLEEHEYNFDLQQDISNTYTNIELCTDDAVHVFPNPATDFIFIGGTNGEIYYEMFDFNGTLIQEGQGLYKINLDMDLSNGLYFIHWQESGVDYSSKFLINR